MRSVVTVFAIAAFAAFLFVPAESAAVVTERDFEGVPIAAAAAGPFPATLQDIQANVFTPSCALSFCHGGAMQSGLELTDGLSYANLVNVPANQTTATRVIPFDPDNSYLICKLEACSWMVGQQMPLIGGPLGQDVIDVIRTWILLGAPEFPPVSVEDQTWGRVKALYR